MILKTKVLAEQAQQPLFNSWITCEGEKRKLTPQTLFSDFHIHVMGNSTACKLTHNTVAAYVTIIF